MLTKPLICLILLFFAGVVNAEDHARQNNRYQTLKRAVFVEPYQNRPTYEVSLDGFGKSGAQADNRLREAAQRTLTSSADLIDFSEGRKLLQANGICFAGRWVIDQASPFSGLFKRGSTSPVIVRASVSLSKVLRKHKRAFGMAIKLLPDDLQDQPSLNIFVLHSIAGVRARHTLDLAMDNQPSLGSLPGLSTIRTALRMQADLEAADKEFLDSQNSNDKIKPDARFRPVTHVAAYRAEKVVSPRWIRLSALTPGRVDEADFRDELAITRYPEQQIVYKLEVAADNGGKKRAANWQTLGKLILTESVTSKACDGKLHFQHPPLDR